MRSGWLQRLAAAVCVALFLLASSTPAWSTDLEDNPAQEETSPVLLDLFVLRPLGIVGAGFSTLFFVVPVAPLTLITRPSDIGKPFDKMVVQPARYVIADPLGKH